MRAAALPDHHEALHPACHVSDPRVCLWIADRCDRYGMPDLPRRRFRPADDVALIGVAHLRDLVLNDGPDRPWEFLPFLTAW